MKRTLLLALLCLLPITARAQVGPISITSAQCATIAVGNNVSTIAVNISGTWTGTLQPQVSIQGQSAANIQVTPSTSSTAQSTITANGVYTAAVAGYDTFLLCGNTVASGTAVVNLNNSVARRGGSTGSGTSGTVTSVATTSPITGGTITGTGTIACAGCVTSSSPGVGLAHFAGSTQAVTSSAVVAADITSGTITGTQLSSSIALPNGATATTQSASDNSTKVATTAYVDTKAGGALVQLETHAATSSAELDFTTCLTNSSYHIFRIYFNQLIPATNTVDLWVRMSTNGGSTYDSGNNYATASFGSDSSGSGSAGNAPGSPNGQMAVRGTAEIQNTANYGITGSYTLYGPAGAAFKNMEGQFSYLNNGPRLATVINHSVYLSTTAVNAFNVLFSSGNIASGTVTCYGVTP